MEITHREIMGHSLLAEAWMRPLLCSWKRQMEIVNHEIIGCMLVLACTLSLQVDIKHYYTCNDIITHVL